MVQEIREKFNQNFTKESYQALLEKLDSQYQYHIPFRVAESPLFISKLLKERLLEACEELSGFIVDPDFNTAMEGAFMDTAWRTPGEDKHTTFLQMDFGVTLDDKGDPMPKLIEVQGFPSVYFFQEFLARMYKDHYQLPDHLTTYIDPDMTSENYIALLRDVIVGNTNPKQVIMLEIEPEKQNTYIDFICTEDALGIKVLCLTKVIKKGKELYYIDEAGDEIRILKIYNRVIFDELFQRPDLKPGFQFNEELDVEWIGHPNWFYKISKYSMPRMTSTYVPKCMFLHEVQVYPSDLENYVLKPLFSFSGSGVVIEVTKEICEAIEHKHHYILQEKVTYHPILQSPDEPVKAEIRMLMIWGKDMKRPLIVNNLVRLSKGKMIGVKYNKDKDWVGGSVGFFED
jgi:hypothetical protein